MCCDASLLQMAARFRAWETEALHCGARTDRQLIVAVTANGPQLEGDGQFDEVCAKPLGIAEIQRVLKPNAWATVVFQSSDAEVSFRKALQINPHYVDARINLAEILLAAGDREGYRREVTLAMGDTLDEERRGQLLARLEQQ